MTTEDTKVEGTKVEGTNTNTDTDTDTDTISVEELQQQISTLTSEAAKQRKAKQVIAKERDDLRSKLEKGNAGEDYKQLWQREQEEKTRLLTGLKGNAIQTAVTTKLTKVGVLPDAIEAAAKLIDHNMITWDMDSGVEDVTVEAAVAKLKSSYGFMFEKKVNPNAPKLPAEGSKTQEKTISRADYNKLTPSRQAELMRKGYKTVA